MNRQIDPENTEISGSNRLTQAPRIAYHMGVV